MRYAGRCLCGACQFSATPHAMEAGACHCAICRKWTGGINLAVGCSDAEWNPDAPITAFRSSERAERAFCAVCGSNLYWREQGAPLGEQVIALMAFDTPEAFPVTRQIFTEQKLASYALTLENPGSRDIGSAPELKDCA